MIKFKDGEVTYVIRGHEDGCPTAFSSNMDECTCKVLRFVETKDTAYVSRIMNKTRAQRREAERAAKREAQRAIRKASKTKAARATGAASKTSSDDGDCSTSAKKGGAV